MPRPLQHPVFLLCAALFIAHQLLQKFVHYPLPFIDSYLDCLLCMPLLLTGLLLEHRYLVFKNAAYRLPANEIVLITFVLAVLFEWGFPMLSDAFTADWGDVIAYAVGSFVFWRYLNQ